MPQPSAAAALIIGASRGLGLGLARAFLAEGRPVIATVRQASAKTGLHALAAEADGAVLVETADIDDASSLGALADRLKGRPVDILMVNAGINADGDDQETFLRVMRTNVFGVMQAVRSLSPLVSAGGAVAAMSSGLGSVAGNASGGMEPYRASKAALNQSLRSFAAERADAGWSVTAADPGWVKTDMGGPHAPLDVETSTAGLTKMLLSRLGQTGSAFLNYKGETVPW